MTEAISKQACYVSEVQLISGDLMIFIPVKEPSLQVEAKLNSDSEFNFVLYLIELQSQQPLFIMKNGETPIRLQICL